MTALFILAVALIGGGLLKILAKEHEEYRRIWKC